VHEHVFKASLIINAATLNGIIERFIASEQHDDA